MKNKWFFLTIVPALTLTLMSVSGQVISSDALAQKLVTQVANIEEKDIVLINGGVRDVELLEDIATHVRKQGAFPLVSLNSDRMNRRYFDEVPPKLDTQVPVFNLKLASIITAYIGVSFSENIGLFADVPPERFAALGKANAAVENLMLESSVRQVYLGNNLYPIEDRAGLFGMSLEQLSDIFWSGVNVEYSKLSMVGESIERKLSRGKEVHITSPIGTDLKVQIEGRPILISDGVISDSDIQKGGAACQVWLPAGEVYLTPVPGTAEGKVVVERQFYQGKEIKNLTLTFKKGKLTSMKADSGLEPLKAAYEAAGEGKEDFAFIDVGINPNVQIMPGSRMVAWMANGMVTVGIGNNMWAGGGNDANYSMANYLPGITLKVDGTVVVRNGELE